MTLARVRGICGLLLSLAGGSGFLLASACRAEPAPADTKDTAQHPPEDASTGTSSTVAPTPFGRGPFTIESVTVDGGDGGAAPNCTGAGDPTLGVDAGAAGCTGALAASIFTYGLCSCTTISASGTLTTDGFDSTKAGPNGGTGGSVGADNGISWSNTTSIGGNLWTPGGVTASGRGTVRGDLHLGGTLSASAPITVNGNAFVVKTLPANATVLGTVSKVASVPPPCDCTNIVPIASITSAHRTTNDNGIIGLSQTAATGSSPARIDLPCGNYYLSQINVSAPLTIAVHGHTALYVDGNVTASGALVFQVDPTATLDLFVAGIFSASGTLTLGPQNNPAHCRAFIAGSSLSLSASANIGCNIYAPNAQISLSGNATTSYGAIFGKGISESGNATVHYDTSILNAGSECCSAAKCDDGNGCTVDSCSGNGTCSHTPATNGTTCGGSNKCQQTYTCQAGACTGSNPVTCAASDQCHAAGTCDPNTGACSNPAVANGTTCSDGNACTQTDTCQTGVCTGSNPVTCAASDQCHVAGTCNAATGVCSNPAAADGVVCNDGDACTQTDSCRAGVCTGTSQVTCVASDQCHVTGTCSPATGLCSNPAAANGAACSDGNACTQTDTCQSGACLGSNPVTCSASDQCHGAGTCNPGTGVCSNPAASDGTACTGTNKCNQAYACVAGACTGSKPVTCAASDQCHVAGVCDSSSGLCSNPAVANGTSCNDGNACTTVDACQSGTCVGSSPVVCTALNQCHGAGTCNPASGVCSNPPAVDGTTCTGTNKCNTTYSCVAGTCAGTNPVTCTASDQCHSAGTCDPAIGACSNPALANGTACNDGNACTTFDACQGGTCMGGSPVVCTALDQCHGAGTCNPASGVCSNPPAVDGTMCTGTNKCNQAYACAAGACMGSNPVTCTASDACHVAGTCDPASGACSNPAASDGTVCTGTNKCSRTYSCVSGACAGSNPVTCTASDQCHASGTCDPVSGGCSNPTAADGTTCMGPNKDRAYACSAGTCAGTAVCLPVDICHRPGTYNTTTATCTPGPLVPIDDGIACTLDTCDPVNGVVHRACSRVDRTVSSSLASTASFLFTGSNPIQTGVAAGTIGSATIAVVRGTVRDATGAALPGVTVTVVGHAEFGSTITQGSGVFDMAVNGGQTLRVHYALANYLPVERLVQAPWQDYITANDVTLVQLDAQVTTIDLSVTTDIQVARGSATTDDAGTRQATVMVPPSTQAVMMLPNGGTASLTTMAVRATEYTVGAKGPSAMPAALPPTSAYTYAVELSADEAISAGATQVAFSQPLPFYVENFLGFPSGTIVPVGSYDKIKGAWVPSTSGVVIKILSENGGGAQIDVDGSGVPASSAQKTALGITTLELQHLATLYPVGQSLWRVQIPHFSGYDLNWGFGPPPGGGGPKPQDPGPPPPGPRPDCRKGSIIGCQRQSLGQALPIAGTPYSLNYVSDHQFGRIAQLEIPLSGPTALPGPVKRIDLEIELAGRLFTQSFPAQTNQTTTFTWDGIDAYGRQLQGAQPITVRVGNTYDGIYEANSRFGESGNGLPLTGSATRREVTIWKFWTGSIGVWDGKPNGLGGWTVNVHHNYDVGAHVLHFGDGNELTPASLPGVIKTLAGKELCSSSTGDNGSATSACVMGPRSVAVRSDGGVYIATAECIRRVGTDGVIQTFAGQCGVSGYSGDEGSATAALLHYASDITFGPDGSLYIADSYNHRIRRIDPGGIIHTVVGSGPAGTTAGSFSGDGLPATQATLDFPSGVDVTADGTIFIADQNNGRIRRVGPDGVIRTVAGNGTNFPHGTDGPATNASLNSPVKVRVASDGGFYVVEFNGQEVRKVGADGIIRAFAGTYGSRGGFGGDGGPATGATISGPVDAAVAPDGSVYILDQNPTVRIVNPKGIIHTVTGRAPGGLAGNATFAGDNGPAAAATFGNSQGIRVAPDGNLYIAHTNDNRVRRVVPGFPFGSSSFQIASEDGTQVYTFDGNGRHLQTTSALTGASLYQFSYDLAGRLSGVADVNGDVTLFNRDSAGNALSVVTPFGGKTTFTVDPNGYLATVTDPASQVSQFTYSAQGLMTTMTDARGGLHQFGYDASGTLAQDKDPAGGTKMLVRTPQPLTGGFSVDLTTALGRKTTYQTMVSDTGTFSRLNTYPDGTQSSLQFGTDATTTTTAADGTTTTTTATPDPRFGMLAAILSTTTKLPSGLTSTQSASRSFTPSSGSLATLTEQTTVNGNTWTRLFDASSRTWTATSPMGRQTSTTLGATGQTTQVATGGVAPWTFTYDSHGRLTTMSQGSRTWTTGYDPAGFVQSVTDPLSHATIYQNDPIGRAIQTILADGRAISTAYDGDGNVTQVTLPAPAQNVHQMNYTPIDFLGSYTPPSIGTGLPSTQYAYNLDGQLTTMTRPDNIVATFGYNSGGRLLSETTPQGMLSQTYNPATGQLSTIVSANGETLTYSYDGFLRTGVTWSGPIAGSLLFGYDASFRVTSQTLNGNALMLGYDADSLLSQAGALAVSRDAQNGRVTGTTLGSVTDSYTYDGNGLFSGYVANYNGGPIYSESVIRDSINRITQKTETIGSETHVWGYTYDVAGRLTDVTKDSAAVSHYGYDADDNRTIFTGPSGTVTPTYDAQDRLLTYGSATYAYTTNGELTSKTVGTQASSYTYDALGNLLHTTLPPNATNIDYIIDGENRRVGKKVNTALVAGFLYQNALNVVAQLDGSGNLAARYVFGTKPNAPDYFTSSAGTFRILSDHLGSPRLILNTLTGATVERIDYDEFGNVTLDTSPGLTPFGFAGGLYDKDTGLVRFGARDYDASVGRWTSKDPVRFKGGMNLYGYAFTDPINRRDLTGNSPASCAACVALIMGANLACAQLEERAPALAATCAEIVGSPDDRCQAACQPDGPPPGPPPGPGPTCRSKPGCDPWNASCLPDYSSYYPGGN